MFTSDQYCCHPSSAVEISIRLLQITALCALFKSNCELAAVYEQSSTHCVLSSCFTACPCMHGALGDFLLLKDSGGDRGGLCVFVREPVSHSVRSVDWSLFPLLLFKSLMYEMQQMEMRNKKMCILSLSYYEPFFFSKSGQVILKSPNI